MISSVNIDTISEYTCPLSPRVIKLLQSAEAKMLSHSGERISRVICDASEYLAKENLRIESYAITQDDSIAWKRVKAFNHICNNLTLRINPDELIIGSMAGNMDPRNFGDQTIPSEIIQQLDTMQIAQRELGIAFGEGHVVCDHERILKEGLKKQSAKINQLISSSDDAQKKNCWKQMLLACDAAHEFALRHAQVLHEEMKAINNPLRVAELEKLADICTQVPWEPAKNFHEALQSLWFQHLLLHIESPSVAYSPGRIDQMLWSYLEKDLENGVITFEQAWELLSCLWIKFREGDESQNITIGGLNNINKDDTNPLSYWILSLTEQLKAFQPSISVRLSKQSPVDLWEASASLMRQGIGQPSVFCDEVVQKSLQSIGIPAQDTSNWAIVGCYEAVIQGAEWARTVACGIQLPHCVLSALEKRELYNSWDDLYKLVIAEINHAVITSCNRANADEAYMAVNAPSAFLSVLMRNCIDNGVDIYSGGSQYNHSSCWLSGLATGIDSLLAVKQTSFDQNLLSINQLIALLDADFSNAEYERQMLLSAEKFGNDTQQSNELASMICMEFCNTVMEQTTPRGGSFQPALAMYQQHYAGLTTGATPDGRHANEIFSKGINPAYGANTNGITATLTSCAQLPHDRAPDGNFLLLSIQPEFTTGENGLQCLIQLMQTYFDAGGSHIMLNVVDAATLQDAIENPQKHRDLLVRVSGLSAYYVTLPMHIQMDLLQQAQMS